ncbi:MAG: hypothetical protein DMD79_07190 [Candidatus Rokuibacteriota bacterium]|nr:MAG: hypothetical protein DMD79_07190 [Candidatus Rokubacteria bacterium]
MDAGSQDGPNRWLRDALKRARAIARRGAPPRPAPRARLGLALAGGFARGIAHIGVLKVLAEHQVSVDYVAGTSVGALIATLYAHGVPLDAMERLAVDTRFKDFGRWWRPIWAGCARPAGLRSCGSRWPSRRRTSARGRPSISPKASWGRLCVPPARTPACSCPCSTGVGRSSTASCRPPYPSTGPASLVPMS